MASAVGVAVRSRLTWRPVTYLDAAGGAVVSIVSVLLIAWLIGSAVVNAGFPSITGEVRNSAVLRTVDSVMPSAARTMFSDFRRLLASGPYPQVFGGIGAEAPLTVGPPLCARASTHTQTANSATNAANTRMRIRSSPINGTGIPTRRAVLSFDC